MPTLETIRRLTIEGRSVGVKEATADLTALGRAQTTVSQTAEGMAVATDSSARRQLSAAKSYDSLRMRVDDVYRSQQRFQKDQAIVQRAFDQGSISAEEHASTMAMVAQRYGTASVAANEKTKQLGLARHELINLGRQAQDVGTMLAMGANVSQVVTSQAAQVIDIFASSQGSFSGFIKQSTTAVGNFLTVGRLAFGGVALSIGTAALALNSYLESQQKVQMSLMGAGRASGASLGDINNVARSSSSLTGFSVSEARAFAAELASTGKIGCENLEPIVKIGHDVATVFGIDAAEAAKMLGRAFSDPAAGAEQLNQRLGFLDAAMQRQIQTLVAQNRIQEAQRVLQAGVASSLENVSQAVSTSTKFWTALGNTASNVWDRIGQAASRATGIGLNLGLEEQIENAKRRVAELEAIASRRSDAVNKALGTADLLTKEKAKLDDLTAAYSRYGQAAVEAQQRAYSFAQAQAVRAQLPALDQTEKLRNDNELLVRTMIDVQTTGGASSPILKAMGLSYEQLAQAVQNSTSKVRNFKTEFEQATQSQQLQMQALTAYSPSAKGEVAYQQRLNAERARETEETKAQTLAEGDRSLAIKGVAVSLSEAARARKLYGEQTVQSAQLEIDLIGQTVGKQAELRANLQARQALEQQASQNRTGFDKAEMARLEEINRRYGERVQLAAKAAVNDNIGFGRQTALLSPDDVSVAQQLRGIYPDVATALDSVEASSIRANTALSGLSSTATTSLVSGLADIVDGSKSVGQGVGDMSKAIVRAMNEAVIKAMVVAPILRSLQSSVGSLFGFGGTSSGALPLPGEASFIGPTFASGGYTGPGEKYTPAGIVHAGEYVFSQASVARIGLANLDRLHRGYAEGGPVTPMPYVANDNRSAPAITVNLIEDASKAGQVSQSQNSDGSFSIDAYVDTIQAKNIANPGSACSRVLAQRGRLASR